MNCIQCKLCGKPVVIGGDHGSIVSFDGSITHAVCPRPNATAANEKGDRGATYMGHAVGCPCELCQFTDRVRANAT